MRWVYRMFFAVCHIFHEIFHEILQNTKNIKCIASLTKQQNVAWAGPKSQYAKKNCFQKSKIKTMLILFFNSNGVALEEFVPEGQMVTKEFCLKGFGSLSVWPEVWKNRNFNFFHNDVMCWRTHMHKHTNNCTSILRRKNKFFKKYTFISYLYKILSKLKKIESVGTSPIDRFYKEK